MNAFDDEQLALCFQVTVTGITGILGNLVRPRWQVTPPIQPPPGVDWIAIGITNRIPFDYPYESWPVTAPYDLSGTMTQQRQERLEVLASVYGPNAGYNAQLLRDGLYVAQNREALSAYGIRLHGVGESRSAPEMIATQWLNKIDLPMTFDRQIDKTYPILTLVSGEITLSPDAASSETISITENG